MRESESVIETEAVLGIPLLPSNWNAKNQDRRVLRAYEKDSLTFW